MDKEGLKALMERRKGEPLSAIEAELLENIHVRDAIKIWEMLQKEDTWNTEMYAYLRGKMGHVDLEELEKLALAWGLAQNQIDEQNLIHPPAQRKNLPLRPAPELFKVSCACNLDRQSASVSKGRTAKVSVVCTSEESASFAAEITRVHIRRSCLSHYAINALVYRKLKYRFVATDIQLQSVIVPLFASTVNCSQVRGALPWRVSVVVRGCKRNPLNNHLYPQVGAETDESHNDGNKSYAVHATAPAAESTVPTGGSSPATQLAHPQAAASSSATSSSPPPTLDRVGGARKENTSVDEVFQFLEVGQPVLGKGRTKKSHWLYPIVLKTNIVSIIAVPLSTDDAQRSFPEVATLETQRKFKHFTILSELLMHEFPGSIFPKLPGLTLSDWKEKLQSQKTSPKDSDSHKECVTIPGTVI